MIYANSREKGVDVVYQRSGSIRKGDNHEGRAMGGCRCQRKHCARSRRNFRGTQLESRHRSEVPGNVSCLSCSMTSARDRRCLSSTASLSMCNAGSRVTCCDSSSDAPSNPPPTQRSMPDSIATSITTAMYAAKKAASVPMITKTATTSPANHQWCHPDGNTRGSDRHTVDGGPRQPRRTANIEYPQTRCHSTASVCFSSPLLGARLKTMSSGITRSVAIINSL